MLGDDNTDVVKFESSVDLRNLPCRTNIVETQHLRQRGSRKIEH